MLRFFKKLAYESEKDNSKAKILQLISFSKKIQKKDHCSTLFSNEFYIMTVKIYLLMKK